MNARRPMHVQFRSDHNNEHAREVMSKYRRLTFYALCCECVMTREDGDEGG